MKTFITVLFEDAETGEIHQPGNGNKIQASFAGPDQALAMTKAGKRKSQFSLYIAMVRPDSPPEGVTVEMVSNFTSTENGKVSSTTEHQLKLYKREVKRSQKALRNGWY